MRRLARVFESTVSRIASGEFYRYGKNETDAKPIFLVILATDIPVPVHPTLYVNIELP